MYTFIFFLTVQSDSLPWSIAEDIMQKQFDLSILGIMVIISLAAIVIGFNIYNTLRINQRQIEEITKKIKAGFDLQINDLFSKKIAALEQQYKNNSREIEEKITAKISRAIIKLHAEKARIFAIVCDRDESYVNAIKWWTEAIENFYAVDDVDLSRRSLIGLKASIIRSTSIKPEIREVIIHCLSLLPGGFSIDKEEIEEEMNKKPIIASK